MNCFTLYLFSQLCISSFQGKKNRDKSLVSLQRHLAQVFVPKHRRYLVLFPEGGFLRKRKAVSQA